MSDTDYKGEPIDASWQTAPWNRDGKTIEASDDDAHEGNMETIDWPENATAKEELNDDQIAVIKTAAKYRNINNSKKLTRIAVPNKHADNYAGVTIKRHWPGRYWVDENKTSSENTVTDKNGSQNKPPAPLRGDENSKAKLSAEDVKEMRVRALKGESVKEIADTFPVKHKTVREAIKGITWGHIEEYPPLEYNHQIGKYERENAQDLSGEKPQLTTEEMRQRALNGEHATDIAENMKCWPETVRMHLRGDKSIGDPETPPLYYDSGSDQCWKLKEEDKDAKENETNTTPRPTPNPTDTSIDKRKVVGVVAVAYVIYRLVRRLL